MALVDIFAFALFVGIVAAVIFGVIYARKAVDAGLASTKETLKAKGLNVSEHGVTMKTDKRFDREDYLDATQRGFVHIIENSSLNKYLDPDKAPQAIQRRTSSQTSDKEKKKRSLFGSKKKVDS